MPAWEEIVEMMYDKYLDTFSLEVVKVIYSKDRSLRYVILKNERGFFTYELEAIRKFYEDEWRYVRLHDKALPALWEPFHTPGGKSFYSDLNSLIKDMQAEGEYKTYFDPESLIQDRSLLK